MKVAVVSVSQALLADLAAVYKEFEQEFPAAVSLTVFYAGRELGDDHRDRLRRRLADADFVIVDLMGSPREWEREIMAVCRDSKGQVVPIGGDSEDIRASLRLGAFTARDMQARAKGGEPPSADTMHKMMAMAEKLGKSLPFGKLRDVRNYVWIIRYWKNAGPYNIRNLFCLMAREYGGNKKVPAPQEPQNMDETGIFDPYSRRFYPTLADYEAAVERFDAAQPTVAFIFYAHSYPNRTTACISRFADKIKMFANVLPIAFSRNTGRDLAKLRHLLLASGKVDLVVNFLAFRLGAGPMGGNADDAVKILEELDVPVLHPFFMARREQEEWEKSSQGVNPSEFLISVMLPELDGAIETIPLGAMGRPRRDETLGMELNELALIDERAEKVAARMQNWLKLRRKPNHEKRVAILCYNYPPGEDNLFGGAFLDTFASVANILRRLKVEGYDVDDLTEDDLRSAFTAGKLVNSGRWSDPADCGLFIRYPAGAYRQATAGDPLAAKVSERWGPAPGGIMTDGQDFLLPGLISGNIFLGLQPTRGIHENPEATYHDKGLPPHHQYMAFYRWLREEFAADAVIHVGTHGTLEFLPGKECGMSGACYPDALIGDLPHLYLYYAGNPAEAMIAKRRSHAVLVGYQPPPFTEGELYGELAQLETAIAEYHEAARVDPGRCQPLRDRIEEKAGQLNLSSRNMDELEQELYRMKRSLIPHGLHVFGAAYSAADAAAYMAFVLRYDRGEIPSLRRLAAEACAMDYDALVAGSDINVLKGLDENVQSLVDEYLRTGTVNKGYFRNKKYAESGKKALEYGYRAYLASIEAREEEGLIRALNGRYLPVKLAGDVIRNPAVLPTGFNLYQFDPRLAPSEAAARRGAAIAENTIGQYRERYGTYPNSVAAVLWGLETSRTQGETVGQILHYLGVRVGSKKNLFHPVYEIIPAAELGRPRIDVVVHMCGFFRDMFPNLIEELNGVFAQVAALDEPEEINYFKADCRRIYRKLLAEGYAEAEAVELSQARLFGPAEGEYGTKVSKLIETRTWQDESELGHTFSRSLQHVYSSRHRGKPAAALHDIQLAAVDIVSQVRSSHEYELVDLDHYYEYIGGLAKAVEISKGSKAEIYISDTTGEAVLTEGVEHSIARGVRTRLLNPKWIDGMLKHNYHGVQKIADRFESILGLAATTNKVENWIYSSLHDKYVADETMRRRLAENNRWAYFAIVERLMEINKRGYWDASEREVHELRQTYLELEGGVEEGL